MSSDEFHPANPVRIWDEKRNEAFRIADALTGVAVFGATGSGKTSGPAKHLAYGYLSAGFGGIVLCAKKEEVEQWKNWARETDRLKDLAIVTRYGSKRFNFLEWEAARSGDGGGLTINIVALLDEIAKAIANDASDGQGGDSKFFNDALRHMNTNLVDLVLFSNLQLSLPLMREIVLTAPQNLDDAKSEKWKAESICAAVLDEAAIHVASLDDAAKADFEECEAYWKVEFPQLAFKTRSIITLMFSMLTRPFTTRPLRRLFCEDTNITPEATFDGKIIIVDLPVQEFRLAGRVAAMAWKYCFQVAIMRRKRVEGTHLRPVFLWADEAQNFVSDFDAEYQAVARSAGGCTVYLTQNRESYRRVLGNDDTTDALLGNLQAKFFCQNAGETNEWAAKLLGERWLDIDSSGFSSGQGDSQGSVSGHVSQQRRYYVEPSRFATLRRGGSLNDYCVEAIVYNGGHQFTDPKTGELVPMRLIRFMQR